MRAAAEGHERGLVIHSIADITRYFGMNPEKTVKGDPRNRTRAQYATDEIMFSDMSPILETELRKCVVGLVAKESRFNAGLGENSKTAKQAFQIIDAVRKDNGFEPKANLSFRQEVEVAGKHFSFLAKEVQLLADSKWISKEGELELVERGENYLEKIRSCFKDNADFEKYFLLPATITSYNAGAGRVGEAIAFFVRDHAEELQSDWQDVTGYDLFMKISEYAYDSNEGLLDEWGNDVVAYFPSVMAGSKVLNQNLTVASSEG